jgi:hypothetical protein
LFVFLLVDEEGAALTHLLTADDEGDCALASAYATSFRLVEAYLIVIVAAVFGTGVAVNVLFRRKRSLPSPP